MKMLGCIGAGKMATAICRGLIRQSIFDVKQIVVSDVGAQARKKFTEITGIECSLDNVLTLQSVDLAILAVKPQTVKDVLLPLNRFFENKLLISIAAGIPIVKLSQWSRSNRVIRVMPNTPVLVGKGTSVFSVSEGVTQADRDVVHKIFGAVGIVKEMPEANMDVITGLTGSGPAYVYEFIQALTDAAEKMGLDPKISLELVVQTVQGASEMVRSNLGTPDELRMAVTSPGGTTAAGLKVLEKNKFRKLIQEVVTRATERSIELGKL